MNKIRFQCVQCGCIDNIDSSFINHDNKNNLLCYCCFNSTNQWNNNFKRTFYPLSSLYLDDQFILKFKFKNTNNIKKFVIKNNIYNSIMSQYSHLIGRNFFDSNNNIFTFKGLEFFDYDSSYNYLFINDTTGDKVYIDSYVKFDDFHLKPTYTIA